MPAASSRRRACESCHVLKIKCDRTQSGCGRCLRLGQKCEPAIRRLQRNRITELEEQIEGLTRALNRQSLNSGPKQDHEESDNIAAFLDARIPQAVQQDLVHIYVRSVVPRLPIVPVGASDYAQLRNDRPILLLAILAFATPGVVNNVVRNELVDMAMKTLGLDLIGSGTATIPHIQAAMLASFWYRSTPKSAGHSTVEQLVQLATSASIAMGLAGPGSAKFSITAIPDPDVLLRDGPRTWLACFIATTAMALSTRRQDSNVWTAYHDECLSYLQISPLATDKLFYILVTINRLHWQIASSLGLYDTSPMIDISESVHQATISTLGTEIDAWSTAVSSSKSPELMFWHQISLVHLNEPVLYTPTNKSSFSAPYLPFKLVPEDFAAPALVTDAHNSALHHLKDACHRALDIAIGLGPSAILSLDSMNFIPRVLFTLLILLKTYIAVSAPGSTYEHVMHKSELQVDHYLSKLGALAGALQDKDGASWNAVILGATKLLKQWFVEYNTGLEILSSSAEGTSTEDGLTPLFTDFAFDADTVARRGTGQWAPTGDEAWTMSLPLDDDLSRLKAW